MSEKYILDKLSEWFDSPCNYTLEGIDIAEFMFDNYGEWCDKFCPRENQDYSSCWRKVFRALEENGK